MQTTFNKCLYDFNQYLRPNKIDVKRETRCICGALFIKLSHSEQLPECCCSLEVTHRCFPVTAQQLCKATEGAGQLPLCPLSHQSPPHACLPAQGCWGPAATLGAPLPPPCLVALRSVAALEVTVAADEEGAPLSIACHSCCH